MGELSKELVQVKQQWNSYLSANYGVAETFRVEFVPHARQQDSVSCGIFCLTFAECLIVEKQEVPTTWTRESVQSYRDEIVTKLVEEGGQEQWCSSICRVCGKAEGPKVQGKPTDSWVCCDTCSPARWYHQQCLHQSLRKAYRNMQFNCSMLEVAPLEFNWTLESNGQQEVVVIEDKENNNKKSTAAVKVWFHGT
ncbi:uncharacterized protein LOC130623898 isoform X3 [Hydractinia symbiolongicarpus]|uniref:uncharacterized protein LOC130623898 isoform X3 n=1 Tax=Hydractinia symbiolongicarpus TaxID=13093 RepID=UPI00254C2CD3|nr:uncharacterized protein LOC130623898 isoform X3 [Hydractinia symbiolongicarpus]